jgi:hypothetical protein
MALNAGKIVIGRIEEPVEAPVKSAQSSRISEKRFSTAQPTRPQSPATIDGHTLTVNGKQKSFSKKSVYLLDMLTLDDE